MLIKPLSDLHPREKGRIVKINRRGKVNRRLLEMGLVPGTMIEVRRIAPLGDPVLIRIKGYDLALRKEEIQNIQVELVLMPLTMAAAGQKVIVEALKAGWGLQRRLTSMGIFPGTEINVISTGRPGQMVIEINGSSLGLGQGIAQKIMVVSSGDTQQ